MKVPFPGPVAFPPVAAPPVAPEPTAFPPVAAPPVVCAYALKTDKELNRSNDATQTTIRDVLTVLVDKLPVIG